MRKNSIYLIFSVVLFLGAIGIGVFFLLLGDKATNETAEEIISPFADFSVGVEGKTSPPPEVTLIAVGDIMLSRDVERAIKAHGADYPFDRMRDVLKSGDIVFGNLETSVTPGREIAVNEMRFRSLPSSLQGLVHAKFSIVSVANNHVPDFGPQGVSDTLRYLDDAKIQHAGAGNTLNQAIAPAIVEVDGLRIAFLAFNDHDVVPNTYGASKDRPGTALMDIDAMTAAVKAAKKKADLVIVSMHSGIEYTATPNTSQKNFAHAAIDAGAEMVIGHHPHVVQTAEKYNGKIIFYSLGNFVFDQMWSEQTKRGLVVKAKITEAGVKSVDFVPVYMQKLGQPQPADAVRAKEILARLGTTASGLTSL